MAKTRAESGNREVVERQVRLDGLEEIMFDRYAGDNRTTLQDFEKLYYMDDGRSVGFPSVNIMSFLSAQNTDSAPKRLLPSKQYKITAQACLSFVSIGPRMIPFTANGLPVVVDKFENDRDALSGIYIHRTVARLKQGIPNPKARPVLPTPWSLSFKLRLYPNDVLQETMVKMLFEKGGEVLGLGTFRGQFGKFKVTQWE